VSGSGHSSLFTPDLVAYLFHVTHLTFHSSYSGGVFMEKKSLDISELSFPHPPLVGLCVFLGGVGGITFL
jgi:hypothetical protein